MKKILHQGIRALLIFFLLAVFLLISYTILGNLEVIKTKSLAFCCWPTQWPPPRFTSTPTPTPTPKTCGWPTLTPTPTPTSAVYPTSTPATPPGATVIPTPTSAPTVEGEGGNGGEGAAGGGPSVCTCETPEAPTLLRVTPVVSSSVELAWTAVAKATHYSIAYGPSSGNYLYGVDNTGKVTTYVVGGLDPAINYCFAVRAVNDCAPSPLSNEICMRQLAGQVLGVTTMAETGSFDRSNFEMILFTIGNLCLGLGLKLLFAKKLAEQLPVKS
jgi:hypothetical protein